MFKEYYRRPDLVLSRRSIQKITQIQEENIIRATSKRDVPLQERGYQEAAACQLLLRRIPFRLQINVDKHLEGRVPETEPGTEPGDRITHTTHRSVCISKGRGEGTEKIRTVAKSFFIKLVSA